jgi:acetyl-CoA carboxylase carboxyltransferase component
MSERRPGQQRGDWQPWLDALARARSRSLELGGAEKVASAMHAKGKLDARQRLAALFDPGSFSEIGGLVGNQQDLPADGFVCGHGEIDGRGAFAGAEDFTILAGSSGSGGAAKRARIAELAVQEGLPLVWMLEGAGARLAANPEGRKTVPVRAPVDLEAMADAKGEVPTVCLVLGVSAGHGALAAPLSDFVVMTRAACMFTGGPALVEAATGERISAEALGGPEICIQTAGSVHNLAPDDAAAIALARDYLGHFPSSRHELAPLRCGADSGPRRVDALLDLIPPNPRQPYPMRAVIEALVDDGRFLEIQPDYGKTVSVGLARMGGRSVAFVANNPGFGAGALDAAGAIKAADFIDTIGRFHLPAIFLIDNPGVRAGSRAEREGILKWGGRMYLAERRLRSPKLSVLMRKGFGFGLVTMAHMPYDHQTLSLALPSASIAAMPAQSGGRTAKLDDAARDKLERAQSGGPLRLANSLGIDDVVDPRELRNALLRGLAMSARRAARLR